MYSLFVTVDVQPDKIDEFVAAISANAASSVRDEPGCLRFDVHRDVETPTRYYFYEVYTDEDAFRTGHLGSAHFARWQAASDVVLIEGSQRIVFADVLHYGAATV
ncbi:putative quinol monooxygenase [Rhodococcus sp. Chr-9]|jgi:autoinducer 2-degrading protein|uniref:putative quinol monooxygenase n=1 Tax=Rhodococcus sp. Chr-9 TaxID=713612 RepID=UPI0005741538|nr:putative quinol monooxygenase [Rhodococcus sp. Chr-9]KHJ73571.1 hypothetical protein QR64_06200 [Rhodococcus sp. Chr-9]